MPEWQTARPVGAMKRGIGQQAVILFRFNPMARGTSPRTALHDSYPNIDLGVGLALGVTFRALHSAPLSDCDAASFTHRTI